MTQISINLTHKNSLNAWVNYLLCSQSPLDTRVIHAGNMKTTERKMPRVHAKMRVHLTCAI